MIVMNYHFDVILASYNGARYIEEQINSILNQVNCQVHVYVFDDGSTDETCVIVNRLSMLHENLSLVIRDVNTGSAGKNFLTSLCELSIREHENCFVAFSDQDDIWRDDKLFRSIQQREKLGWDLYCSNLAIVKDGEHIGTLKKDFQQRKFDHLFEGGSAGCTYVMSYNLAKEVSCIYSSLLLENWPAFSHDWFIYFVARNKRMPVLIDSFESVEYRIHDRNVHGSLSTGSFRAFWGKYRLLNKGWFKGHVENFRLLVKEGSKERSLYDAYLYSSRLGRAWTFIRFGFRLRSLKRTIFLYIHLLVAKI